MVKDYYGSVFPIMSNGVDLWGGPLNTYKVFLQQNVAQYAQLWD